MAHTCMRILGALLEDMWHIFLVEMSWHLVGMTLLLHSLSHTSPPSHAHISLFPSINSLFPSTSPFSLFPSCILLFPSAFSYFLVQFLILMCILPYFSLFLVHSFIYLMRISFLSMHSIFHSHTCAYFLPSPLILFPMCIYL
jgi:hypothetical protein